MRNLIRSLNFSFGTTSAAESTSLAKFVAASLSLSRRGAEKLIQEGKVHVNGQIQSFKGAMVLRSDIDSIRFDGKPLPLVRQKVLVWAVHKLPGEEVADHAESKIPSMMERLRRGGVGKVRGTRHHLKPVGRLDVPTEGLILVTNNGDFARDMEQPSNKVHRSYRVRAHGLVRDWKLDRIQRGLTIDGVRYSPMKVRVTSTSKRVASTNQWFHVTCYEGKNRQIRKVFAALGLKITRLIRTAFGDYSLDTIPPGMAIPVPYKPMDRQTKKGNLFSTRKKRSKKKLQVKKMRALPSGNPHGKRKTRSNHPSSGSETYDRM